MAVKETFHDSQRRGYSVLTGEPEARVAEWDRRRCAELLGQSAGSGSVAPEDVERLQARRPWHDVPEPAPSPEA